MTDSIRIFINTLQTNKHIPNKQNNDMIMGFTSNTIYALTTEATQILQYSYSNFALNRQHK